MIPNSKVKPPKVFVSSLTTFMHGSIQEAGNDMIEQNSKTCVIHEYHLVKSYTCSMGFIHVCSPTGKELTTIFCRREDHFLPS